MFYYSCAQTYKTFQEILEMTIVNNTESVHLSDGYY